MFKFLNQRLKAFLKPKKKFLFFSTLTSIKIIFHLMLIPIWFHNPSHLSSVFIVNTKKNWGSKFPFTAVLAWQCQSFWDYLIGGCFLAFYDEHKQHLVWWLIHRLGCFQIQQILLHSFYYSWLEIWKCDEWATDFVTVFRLWVLFDGYLGECLSVMLQIFVEF